MIDDSKIVGYLGVYYLVRCKMHFVACNLYSEREREAAICV